MTWIVAFSLTQMIEITVGLLIWRKEKGSLSRKIGILFGASALTHPLVWFVFPKMSAEWGLTYPEYLLMAEAYAYCVEAFYYFSLRISRPILLSTVTNSCSFLTGLFVHEFVL